MPKVLLLALAIAAAALAAALPAPALAMPWGANNWHSVAADWNAARELGLTFFRLSFSTDRPASSNDDVVRELAARYIEATPFLTRAEAGRPAPPRSGAELRRWSGDVAALVRRYGRNGTFWAENSELPYLPVRHWEIWNEPDNPSSWRGAPDPYEYRRVLAAAEGQVHRVDPRADVVFAGLAGDRHDFFGRVQSGPAAPLDFQSVGFHTYPTSPDRALEIVRRFRRKLDSTGRSSARLWVNEVGRDSSPSEAGQAAFLDRFATLAREHERELRLGPTFLFCLRDHPTGRFRRYGRMGLLRADYTRRPAFEAVRAQIGGERSWFTGPNDLLRALARRPSSLGGREFGPHDAAERSP